MPLTGSSDALIQAHKALMVLSHNADFVSLPRSRKLALLVDFCIEKIGVGRVSIWNFTASENSISCELLHDTAMATALISQQGSLQLSACDHPVYFDAIRQERVLAANDARQDPRTASFAHDYLLQHG
ncbi:MAG: sensor domain-containing phosphodiesterase, partial [Marinobacterium sp.]